MADPKREIVSFRSCVRASERAGGDQREGWGRTRGVPDLDNLLLLPILALGCEGGFFPGNDYSEEIPAGAPGGPVMEKIYKLTSGRLIWL